MSNDLPIPPEDKQELERIEQLLRRKPVIAMDFQLPDERFLRPNKEHHHFDLHMTEETGMTVINTYHFKTGDGIKAAIAAIKTKLPPRLDERENIETTAQDTPEAGNEAEGSEKGLEFHSPPGAS